MQKNKNLLTEKTHKKIELHAEPLLSNQRHRETKKTSFCEDEKGAKNSIRLKSPIGWLFLCNGKENVGSPKG
jgi:hypothetical protein